MAITKPFIAIIDVGHGNAAVIHDGKSTVIVDCGARGAGLLEFLASEKIISVDTIFLSHSDYDHIGGILPLLSDSTLDIKEVVVNGDATKNSKVWNDLTYELAQRNEDRKMKFSIGITREKTPRKCGEIEYFITGPTPYLAGKAVGGKDKYDRKITSNSISASFHVFWNGKPKIFLAGDLDQIGLDDLLDFNADLTAEFVVFPHHGGDPGQFDPEKFAAQLFSQTKSKVVIFSMGRNKFSNPNPKIISGIRKINSKARISCTQLSNHCIKELVKKPLHHLAETYSLGASTYESCSGTFVLQLKDNNVFPEHAQHAEFIAGSTTSPLCN